MSSPSIADLFKTTSAQPADPKRRPVPKRMADCPMRACDRHCKPCTCAACDCDGCKARGTYARRERSIVHPSTKDAFDILEGQPRVHPLSTGETPERPVVAVSVADVQQSLF